MALGSFSHMICSGTVHDNGFHSPANEIHRELIRGVFWTEWGRALCQMKLLVSWDAILPHAPQDPCSCTHPSQEGKWISPSECCRLVLMTSCSHPALWGGFHCYSHKTGLWEVGRLLPLLWESTGRCTRSGFSQQPSCWASNPMALPTRPYLILHIFTFWVNFQCLSSNIGSQSCEVSKLILLTKG